MSGGGGELFCGEGCFYGRNLISTNVMNKKTTKIWVAVGAIVLIILLIVWLEFAFLAGDTDVTACATLASSVLNA